MDEVRCKNCKHWQHTPFHAGFGDCKAVRLWNNFAIFDKDGAWRDTNQVIFVQDEQRRAKYYIGENYSCKHFQKKG